MIAERGQLLSQLECSKIPERDAHSDLPRKKWKMRSLGEVLADALKILNPDGNEDVSTKRWLTRNALRAVCDAVIAGGGCPAPLKVKFSTPIEAALMELPASKDRFQHWRN